MTNLNWTKKEFQAYILIYAAHCNYFETKEEENFILSKVENEIYQKMHTEVVVDSEEENINKIQQYLFENKFSENEKEQLIRDLKTVFFADGTVDVMEKKVFTILKKIIS